MESNEIAQEAAQAEAEHFLVANAEAYGWRTRYRVPERLLNDLIAHLLLDANLANKPVPNLIIMDRDFPIPPYNEPRPEGAIDTFILWVQHTPRVNLEEAIKGLREGKSFEQFDETSNTKMTLTPINKSQFSYAVLIQDELGGAGGTVHISYSAIPMHLPQHGWQLVEEPS